MEAREEGQSALQAARTIEAEHATREMNIQSQLQTLRTTQRQIAKVSGSVVAERLRAPNSSSGFSDQQSVGLSPSRDTCP